MTRPIMHRSDSINGTHKTCDELKWSHTGKIVARSGNNLLIIPPDAGGLAQIGMLKP